MDLMVKSHTATICLEFNGMMAICAEGRGSSVSKAIYKGQDRVVQENDRKLRDMPRGGVCSMSGSSSVGDGLVDSLEDILKHKGEGDYEGGMRDLYFQCANKVNTLAKNPFKVFHFGFDKDGDVSILLLDHNLKLPSKIRPGLWDRDSKKAGYIVTSGSGGDDSFRFAVSSLDLRSKTLDLQVEVKKAIAYSCLTNPSCGGFLTTYIIKKGHRPLIVDKYCHFLRVVSEHYSTFSDYLGNCVITLQFLSDKISDTYTQKSANWLEDHFGEKVGKKVEVKVLAKCSTLISRLVRFQSRDDCSAFYMNEFEESPFAKSTGVLRLSAEKETISRLARMCKNTFHEGFNISREYYNPHNSRD
jgi:hypothetical protein